MRAFKPLFGMLLLCLSAGQASAQALTGVNLAGPAFSPQAIPGIYGQDYIFPTPAEIAYFTVKGMNIFRISLLWERLQPNLNGALDPDEITRLNAFITDANAHGAAVIIDLHNYGRYGNTLIGQAPVTDAAFADIWARLARQYGDNPRISFGLMNEPQLGDANAWQRAVQQAIDAIRRTGARNPILVSGIDWDSAAGFAQNSGQLSSLNDPAHRLIFEVHEYFDADGSGTHPDCIAPGAALARLAPFTQWLHATGNRGFLGEFGVSRAPECQPVLQAVVRYLKQNRNVWAGWTYWAAGPAWGDYMFTLEPEEGVDRPQMQALLNR